MRSKISKKELARTVSACFVMLFAFMRLEPAITDAATNNTSVNVTYTVANDIAISGMANVNLASIPGITGGSAAGQTSVTVKTNNATGFKLNLRSSTATAMMHSDAVTNIPNYAPSGGATPDYAWAVPSSAAFGYTVEPATVADTVAAFRDNGTACNVGALNNTDTCWQGFAAGGLDVINRSTPTTYSGEAEVIKVKTQIAANAFQKSGTYTATITATATCN